MITRSLREYAITRKIISVVFPPLRFRHPRLWNGMVEKSTFSRRSEKKGNRLIRCEAIRIIVFALALYMYITEQNAPHEAKTVNNRH